MCMYLLMVLSLLTGQVVYSMEPTTVEGSEKKGEEFLCGSLKKHKDDSGYHNWYVSLGSRTAEEKKAIQEVVADELRRKAEYQSKGLTDPLDFQRGFSVRAIEEIKTPSKIEVNAAGPFHYGWEAGRLAERRELQRNFWVRRSAIAIADDQKEEILAALAKNGYFLSEDRQMAIWSKTNLAQDPAEVALNVGLAHRQEAGVPLHNDQPTESQPVSTEAPVPSPRRSSLFLRKNMLPEQDRENLTHDLERIGAVAGQGTLEYALNDSSLQVDQEASTAGEKLVSVVYQRGSTAGYLSGRKRGMAYGIGLGVVGTAMAGVGGYFAWKRWSSSSF